jgi:iron complex outermembrane receptor protein
MRLKAILNPGRIKIYLLPILFLSFPIAAVAEDSYKEALALGLEELMETKVSISSLRPKPVYKSPGTVSIITSRDISNMPARHLTDILKTLPGFDVRYNNFGEYFVSSGGIDNPSNILMMINGHRFNDFYSGGALYDIPVDNIEKVEIIRGPGSAIYGTNAMIAVINIITKKREAVKVKAGGGTYDTKKANLEYGRKGKDLSLFAFGEIYDTAGADGVVNSDALLHTPQYSRAPMKQKDNKRKYTLNAVMEYKSTEFSMNYYREDRGPNLAYENILSDKSEVSAEFVSMDIKRSFGSEERLKFTPRIYFDRWVWNNRIQLYPDGYTDNRDLNNDGSVEYFPDGIRQNKSHEFYTIGAETKLEKRLDAVHHFTGGITIEGSALSKTSIETNYSGEPSSGAVVRPYFSNWNNYSFPQKSRMVYAAFVQDDWELNENTNFVAGIRHDHYSDFGGSTNPRMSLIHSPTKKVDVKVQYATAFRAPTFKELYDKTNIQFYGNENLGAERLESIEAGIWYKYKKNSYIYLNSFRSIIRDYITTMFNTSMAVTTEYENSGTLEVNGYSIESRHTFDNYTWINWNATLFNTRDEKSSSWITNYPQFRGNAGVNFSLPSMTFVSLYYMYSDIARANARTFQERALDVRAKTGPFHMINLAITKKDILNSFNIKLSAFNLLNTDYRELYSDVRYRLPGANEVYETKNLIPSNQRMFMLEIEKEF